MTVFLSYPWKEKHPGLFQAGRPEGFVPAEEAGQREWLLRQRVHFGVVWKARETLFACTDRTRSYPLFYTLQNEELYLSDHPDKLKPYLPDATLDDEAAALYMASGYCPGDATLLRGVRQLQSGEMLRWDVKTKTLRIDAWYHYVPQFPAQCGQDNLSALGETLDHAVDRVIEQAAGRAIWVPLSGGLDSRAVLCKLHEKKYPRLQAFSYGAAGNTEAQTARDVAAALDVPWRFVEPDYAAQKQFFESDEATQFMRSAMRLSSGPSFTDFFALKTLSEEKAIGPDTVIVNGQSGDYLTGGHLPRLPGQDDAFQSLKTYYLNKHFGLWKPLQDEKAKAEQFITEQYAFFAQHFLFPAPYLQAYRFFTWFEWRERQSKYVVACQVNYDYFGLDWALPLWDAELMDLYARLPFDQFIAQNLYIAWLHRWNYRNQFSFIRRPYDPWPRNRIAVLGAGRAVGLIAGTEAKQSFYRFMRYWSSHDVHFKLMPATAWAGLWRDLENAEGFYALAGLLRSGLQPDSGPVPAAWKSLLRDKAARFA